MDITLITKIVAAGAMGVSAYCVFKVYELEQVYLSRSWQTWNKDNEQSDKEKYKSFLKKIYRNLRRNRLD